MSCCALRLKLLINCASDSLVCPFLHTPLVKSVNTNPTDMQPEYQDFRIYSLICVNSSKHCKILPYPTLYLHNNV